MEFRSPGARPSPRVHKQHIPDGPIQDFTAVIESTVSEDWQKRTSALQTLVSSIPSSYGRSENNDKGNTNNEYWYSSPPTLRHLAIPFSELIKDARSTVVKRTCESLEELFTKCKSDARYLFKDLMQTVCSVHATTVQVIRNYVQTLILETIPCVPCKMSMPIWLDRLKNDKSRTVREACSLYLSTSMAEWGATSDDDFDNDNNGYLSRGIYLQVGTILVKSLRDPSTTVRQNCKRGLEIISTQQNDVVDELINDKSLTRDLRIKKLLKRLQEGEAVGDDNMSVASRMSRDGASIASAPIVRSGYGGTSGSSYHRSTGRYNNQHLRTPIRHRTPISPGRSPPPRIPTSIGVIAPPLPTSSKAISGLGPPRRMLNGISSTSTTTKRTALNSTGELFTSTPATHISSSFSTPKQAHNIIVGTHLDNKSFDSTETDTPLKPIANAEELRQFARTRTGMGSRRSSLLQDRFLRSASKKVLLSSQTECGINNTSSGGEIENNGTNNNDNNSIDSSIKSVTRMMDVVDLKEDEISDHPNLPIHMKIAHELLEAHKLHVEDLMQILKVEMEMLKDFELIILEQGPRRPTDEEVLEYFESMGLCLEQRKKAERFLQKKMDRISQG